MSWDVDLKQAGKIMQVDRHEEGGTYLMGGTTDASLSITYNYCRYYYRHLHNRGLMHINRKRARTVVPLLERAVNELGTDRDDDYWKATPGNAGYALSILLGWARQFPDATFKVT